MSTTITSVEEALNLYSQNLNFEDISQAKNALRALRYLKLHRAQAMSHVGSSLNFSEIDTTITRLEQLIDIQRPRASWTAARSRYSDPRRR